MSEEEWRAWAQDMRDKLRERSVADGRGCRVWRGARTQSKPGAPPYGIIRTKPPGATNRKALRVHVLAYVTSDISARRTIMRKKTCDVSHICHTSLCIDPSHLSVESRSINNCRRTCRSNGDCQGHGLQYPDCLIIT